MTGHFSPFKIHSRQLLHPSAPRMLLTRKVINTNFVLFDSLSKLYLHRNDMSIYVVNDERSNITS